MKNSRPTWDEYFMHLAEESASRSKDPNTKVGACVVKDLTVLSLGYNGAPRLFPDKLVPLGRDSTLPLRLQKNTFMCHAELNAILNYKGNLSEFANSTIYVTVFPCHECAKALAQIGVKEIVYKDEYHRKEIFETAKYILDTCGINYRKLED